MKVLLDTDIGSDIDDAVCLSYLLGQTRCELVGITTVTGEAVKRAQMASALCDIAGRDVPIYPGAEEPLVIEQKQPKAPQAAALTQKEKARRFPKGEAVDFLRRTIREYPGEIHLLTIGPLTNVGLLFGLDPEIPSLLSGLTAMAGVYLEQTRDVHPKEWNVACDPHAAAIVLRKAPMNTKLIGLDVTLQVTMSAREVKSRFTSPLLSRVAEFAQIWFEKAENITFHDPLAAAVLFDEEICGYQQGIVRVDLQEGRNSGEEQALGATHYESTEVEEGTILKPLRVATSVNSDAFFREYFSVFGKTVP